MKTNLFTIVLSVFFALSMSAPIEVSARNHKNPYWAHSHKYKEHTRHIYFPEYNMYYDIQRASYIYINNGRWSVSLDLPIRLGSRNFSNARYVELNGNSRVPECYTEVRNNGYRQEVRCENDDRSYSDNKHYKKHPHDKYYQNEKKWKNHDDRDDYERNYRR